MRFSILVVGNEILAGDITETNSNHIARRIREMGHRVERIVVVPDRVEDIAEELRRLMRYDFVFVTGGLGPTHDDVTAEGVAKALGKKLEKNHEAEKQILRWTDNREVLEKVSMLPEGSEVIRNDVGVAPAFVVENVAVMPGVPKEMKDTFERIVARFISESYHEEEIKIHGLEENIIPQLREVVERFPDVEVGSYPKLGHVVVKFKGEDERRVKEARSYFEGLLRA